jgi:hypothetical protein
VSPSRDLRTALAKESAENGSPKDKPEGRQKVAAGTKGDEEDQEDFVDIENDKGAEIFGRLASVQGRWKV